MLRSSCAHHHHSCSSTVPSSSSSSPSSRVTKSHLTGRRSHHHPSQRKSITSVKIFQQDNGQKTIDDGMPTRDEEQEAIEALEAILEKDKFKKLVYEPQGYLLQTVQEGQSGERVTILFPRKPCTTVPQPLISVTKLTSQFGIVP